MEEITEIYGMRGRFTLLDKSQEGGRWYKLFACEKYQYALLFCGAEGVKDETELINSVPDEKLDEIKDAVNIRENVTVMLRRIEGETADCSILKDRFLDDLDECRACLKA